MSSTLEDLGKELSSKLSDTDKAYIAGLFDGEGCIDATFGSKKSFCKREKREKIYLTPKINFVISNKSNLLLELIKSIIGFGDAPKRKIYRDKRSGTYSYRITGRKQVFSMVNAILPFVRLKNDGLEVSRDALLYLFDRKPRSKWTGEELVFFREEFVQKLQKLLPSGRKGGRPPKYNFDEIISKYY